MVSRRSGQPTEGQPVDYDSRAIRKLDQGPCEAGSCPHVRLVKVPTELVHYYLPTQPPQPHDHPGVVDVAAGALVQRAWDDHVEFGTAHTEPS